MKCRRGRAFTLVEMLVVIAIIGILITLMLPGISRAIDRAREAKCKANLKNLHVAAMNYFYDTVDENGQHHYPHARSSEYYDYEPTAANPNAGDWEENIGWVAWLDYEKGHNPNQPGSPKPGTYAAWWGDEARTSITNGSLWEWTSRTFKTYVCPTFLAVCGTEPPDAAVLPFKPWRSYGMNMSASYRTAGNMPGGPSKCLLFADMAVDREDEDGNRIAERCMTDGQRYDWDPMLEGTPVTPQYPRESVGAFHNGMGLAVFADGHTEKLSPAQTVNACAGVW